jgi:hypothetical protein
MDGSFRQALARWETIHPGLTRQGSKSVLRLIVFMRSKTGAGSASKAIEPAK